MAKQEGRGNARAGTFEAMGLDSTILKGVKQRGYRVPTPVQRKAMPLALEGRDVVAMARTGSGKTAAFLLPILQSLQSHEERTNPRAVVLAPTRELALQTLKFARQLGKHTNLRTCALVGGDALEAQFEALSYCPDLVVATPGRLLHHLEEVHGFNLRSLQLLVFDEADRLFELGLGEQIRDLLKRTTEARQTMLFSATLPSVVADFAQAGLKSPSLVRLDTETKISNDLEPHFFLIREEDKPAALMHLLTCVVPREEQTLVFTSTRHHVEFLSTLLQRESVQCTGVYGAMDQEARDQAMKRFKAGHEKVLVVTDVAARGLDIPLLDNTVNYDFPTKPKLFVHRVGRVARQGRRGRAYSFVQRDELGYLVDLHLFLGKQLTCANRTPPESKDAADEEVQRKLSQGVSILGRYPARALSDLESRYKQLVSEDEEIATLQRSSYNAYKLYMKTRPSASAESHSRAKDLDESGAHPLLVSCSDEVAQRAANPNFVDFTERIRSYRPSSTVLEADIAPSKRFEGFGGTNVSGAPKTKHFSPVMQAKRAAHEKNILEKAEPPQKRARTTASSNDIDDGEVGSKKSNFAETTVTQPVTSKPSQLAPETAFTGKYKDTSFFIDNAPKVSYYQERGYELSKGNNIKDAVLDIQQEDAEGVKRQQSVRRWDQKKKKYVMVSQGSQERKGRRKEKTESGQTIRKGINDIGSGLYKQWKKKTQKQPETTEAPGRTVSSKRKRASNIPNKHVRSELKPTSQILSERRERLQQKQKAQQRKPASTKTSQKHKKS